MGKISSVRFGLHIFTIIYTHLQSFTYIYVLNISIIELDDGKIYRKPLFLMVNTMVSCRFSLKPIHWIWRWWVGTPHLCAIREDLQGLALLLLRLLSGGNQDRDGRIHGIHVNHHFFSRFWTGKNIGKSMQNTIESPFVPRFLSIMVIKWNLYVVFFL